MNANNFSIAMGEVSEKYVIEAANYQQKHKKTGWVKWGAVAACLCLVIVSALVIPTLLNSNAPTPVTQQGNHAVVSNSIPQPGTYYFHANVNAAREYYSGQDVTFLLTFDMFDADGRQLSEEEKATEYERLSELGYKLYETEYWTYQGEGEKEYRDITIGLFSESELADFDASDDYGYAFRFVENGDSSSITIDDNILEYSQADIVEKF